MLYEWDRRKKQEQVHKKLVKLQEEEEKKLMKQRKQEAGYSMFKEWLKNSLIKQREELV